MTSRWLAVLLVSVTVLHPCLSQEQDLVHVGCFRDARDRDLGRLVYAAAHDNSIEKCKEICQTLGFEYAGVQYSSQCFCGNDFGKHGMANNCNMKCSGNDKQICGGAWANNVYVAAGLEPVAEGILGHFGCFKDAGDRDLERLAYVGGNTIEQCKETCHKLGFKYAGVQNSSQCFCGNDFGKHGMTNNCNMKCSGNGKQICGGAWANNVYVAVDLSKLADGSSVNKGKRLYD